jgi:UDP-glucose-4-epimerase GalE
MNVLVCGGAGYIGSHMCKRLSLEGHVPITFDNLSTGHVWAVKWGPLLRGDLLDPGALANTFRDHRIEAVMHFAARSLVSESVQSPELYFRNNVTGTLNLLDAMRIAKVGKLIFSSTAAVYGTPDYTPIDEAHPTRPINPYGWSKLMAERVIEESCNAHGMRAISLRYFNAAGSDLDGQIGEAHEPETHLIPNVIRAAIDASREPVKLFGDDYDTPDGTCVRDYVHVEDLSDAHLRSLDLLERTTGYQMFNLGSGHGCSVAQVIAVCREQCDGAPASTIAPRRRGDPAVLIASNSAAAAALGWVPHRTLKDCVRSAIVWHRPRP